MNDPSKPAGSPDDFKMQSPHEAEARRLKAKADAEGDQEFRAEMARLDKIKKDAEKARKEFEAKRTSGAAPAKVYQLLVAKIEGKFKVVGFYSGRPELAQALISDEVAAYAAAGIVLGNVEFDLAVKLDQPPVPPS